MSIPASYKSRTAPPTPALRCASAALDCFASDAMLIRTSARNAAEATARRPDTTTLHPTIAGAASRAHTTERVQRAVSHSSLVARCRCETCRSGIVHFCSFILHVASFICSIGCFVCALPKRRDVFFFCVIHLFNWLFWGEAKSISIPHSIDVSSIRFVEKNGILFRCVKCLNPIEMLLNRASPFLSTLPCIAWRTFPFTRPPRWAPRRGPPGRPVRKTKCMLLLLLLCAWKYVRTQCYQNQTKRERVCERERECVCVCERECVRERVNE